MKHSQKLIDQAHELSVWQPNKEVAKELNLTANQLHYVLYKLKPQQIIPERERTLQAKEPTITESFLNFFISEDFR